ncbi:MAG: DUF2807 domain-containing protein [Paramuribaculum sp.]|nr:DUF2807 domain-containing protein [Paramuribaculum sp.]
MKKYIFTLLLFSSALTMLAAKPEMVKFKVPAQTVTSIEANKAFKVVYTQSPNTSVTVIAPKRIKDKIKVRIKEGKLTTGFSGSANMTSNESITVIVTAPAVNDFEANSAASITIKGALSLPSSEVDIELSSAASFTADAINCAKLEIDCSSASSATIASCNTKTVEAESSSAASLTVKGINATTVKGNSSSAASLTLSGSCITARLSKSSMGSLSSSGLKTKK